MPNTVLFHGMRPRVVSMDCASALDAWHVNLIPECNTESVSDTRPPSVPASIRAPIAHVQHIRSIASVISDHVTDSKRGDNRESACTSIGDIPVLCGTDNIEWILSFVTAFHASPFCILDMSVPAWACKMFRACKPSALASHMRAVRMLDVPALEASFTTYLASIMLAAGPSAFVKWLPPPETRTDITDGIFEDVCEEYKDMASQGATASVDAYTESPDHTRARPTALSATSWNVDGALAWCTPMRRYDFVAGETVTVRQLHASVARAGPQSESVMDALSTCLSADEFVAAIQLAAAHANHTFPLPQENANMGAALWFEHFPPPLLVNAVISDA